MDNERYTTTAIGLHWLIGLMILISFSVGLYMSNLPLSPTKLKIYSWHKWAGVTIFMLVVLRCTWRLFHTPPAMPDHMPRWQQIVAEATHYLLYALMFAIPLSGWLMSSAKGFQTVYFGLLPIPDLLDKNKELGDTLNVVHAWLNYLMITTVAAHAAAALKHHFIDKDEVLVRMVPRRRKAAPAEAAAPAEPTLPAETQP